MSKVQTIVSPPPAGLIANFGSDYIDGWSWEETVMGFNADGEALIAHNGRLVTIKGWIKIQETEETWVNSCHGAPIPKGEITFFGLQVDVAPTFIPAEPGTEAVWATDRKAQVVAWRIEGTSAYPVTAKSGQSGFGRDYPKLVSDIEAESTES